MSRVIFLKQFFRDRKEIGSITPSSRFLVRKMLRSCDFENAKVLVELGPGTGCFTKELLEQMRPDATLVAFETNKTFCDALRKQFPDKRLIIVNDSAEKICEYLELHNLPKADFAISGLPLTNFPMALRMGIIGEAVKCLKPAGVFTQYQYFTTARKVLKQFFKNVKIRWTPANIPPAFYYTCTN